MLTLSREGLGFQGCGFKGLGYQGIIVVSIFFSIYPI